MSSYIEIDNIINELIRMKRKRSFLFNSYDEEVKGKSNTKKKSKLEYQILINDYVKKIKSNIIINEMNNRYDATEKSKRSNHYDQKLITDYFQKKSHQPYRDKSLYNDKNVKNQRNENKINNKEINHSNTIIEESGVINISEDQSYENSNINKKVEVIVISDDESDDEMNNCRYSLRKRKYYSKQKSPYFCCTQLKKKRNKIKNIKENDNNKCIQSSEKKRKNEIKNLISDYNNERNTKTTIDINTSKNTNNNNTITTTTASSNVNSFDDVTVNTTSTINANTIICDSDITTVTATDTNINKNINTN